MALEFSQDGLWRTGMATPVTGVSLSDEFHGISVYAEQTQCALFGSRKLYGRVLPSNSHGVHSVSNAKVYISFIWRAV